MWDLLLILPLGSMMCSDFRMRRITLADLLLFGILQWGMSYCEWGVLCIFCENIRKSVVALLYRNNCSRVLLPALRQKIVT